MQTNPSRITFIDTIHGTPSADVKIRL